MPGRLGGILIVLGLLLFSGAIAIVGAAAGESVLPAGAIATQALRRKYWIAGIVTGIVLVAALVGGRIWWNAEERIFRVRLLTGGWPDLTASTRLTGSGRVLDLKPWAKGTMARKRVCDSCRTMGN